MSSDVKLNYYRKGLELAEAGKYGEALAYLQEYIRICPDDTQALNDTGAVLHCLGRSAEAIDCFVRARKTHIDSPQITWNLVEAYLAECRPEEASQLFDDMEQMDILNVDVLNRTAKVFLDLNKKSEAIEVLLRSLRVWSDQEILKPMIEVIRSKRPQVSFFCGLKGDVKFLADIYEFTDLRFPVQFFQGQSINQMHELMKNSDICWFEWCTDMVVEASKLPKVSKNIVRLHRFEAYNIWPSQVQWENIDVLIIVGNSFVKEALLKQVPDIETRTQLIEITNGVNLHKYKFVDKKRGKNIACVGYLNLRKNPMFLLQCMQKLHYIDPDYKLFFAGVFQDPMLEQYVTHMVHTLGLEEAVFFDDWQKDINQWLKDKHYIVSSSIGESQGMGLLEAMACGLKPVIHNFPGADQIFPAEFLFNISEEFCQQILSENYEPQSYRRFVEENYPLKRQLEQISDILNRLETEIDLQQSSGAETNEENFRISEDADPSLKFDGAVF